MPVVTTPPNVIVVNDAALVAAGTAFGLVEGQTFNGTVATFIDGNKASVSADFHATIDWGDGSSPTKATIVPAGAGSFGVTGLAHLPSGHVDNPSHNRARYSPRHGPRRPAADRSHRAATTAATITDATIALSTAGVRPLTTTEGSIFSGIVAYLTDNNPYATVADYTKTPTKTGNVTITWGDGTSVDTTSLDSNGNPLLTILPVLPLPNGKPRQFEILSSHEYDDFGKYPIGISAKDDGSSASTAAQTITITDAAFTAVGVGQLQALEGVPFTDTVATFSDSNSHPNLDDFTATIVWGDGDDIIGICEPKQRRHV